MVAVPKQIELGGLQDEADERAEIEAGYLWREQLWSAMRQFVAGYREGNLKGYDAAAAALDKRWGEKGRPVSASALRSALHDVERNSFRLEWVDWFAARDPDIANLVARRVKPIKTPEQELEDLRAELMAELPRQADKIIRRARAR
jgi:hypothetical protein